jgi:hypothetical protein
MGLDQILFEMDSLKESVIYKKMYNGSLFRKKKFSHDAELIVDEKIILDILY